MARIRLTYLVFLIGFGAFAQNPSEDLFQKGLDAYQKRNYEQARASFEQILSQGVVTAHLLHNLALTYYQMNQKPQAVGLWRKALYIDPGYKAARSGRDLLENRFNMRPFERDSLSAWMRHALEYVSIYQLLWLTAFVLSLAGWLWLRYASERRHSLDEQRPLPPFPYAAIAGSMLLLLTGTLSAFKAVDVITPRATVVAEKASLRSLPADDAVALLDIPGGSEVVIRREGQDWLQVQDSGGSTGWVRNTELLVTSRR